MIHTAILLTACCLQAPAESGGDASLLDLIEKRATMRLHYGDQHPAVRDLEGVIHTRISSGEAVGVTAAEQRLHLLMADRHSLKRHYGLSHVKLKLNALRIQAVASALADQTVK